MTVSRDCLSWERAAGAAKHQHGLACDERGRPYTSHSAEVNENIYSIPDVFRKQVRYPLQVAYGWKPSVSPFRLHFLQISSILG